MPVIVDWIAHLYQANKFAVDWVAHQQALVPLITLLCLSARKRFSVVWWLIAAGLGVSWLADSWSRIIDWRLITYLYPPIQLGMIYLALLIYQPHRFLQIVSGVALLTLISFALGNWHTPEVLTYIVGSTLAVTLVWKRRDLGLVREGLLVYFGVGVFFWVAGAYTVTNHNAFLLAWIGYQITRLIGLTLVTTAMVKHGLHT